MQLKSIINRSHAGGFSFFKLVDPSIVVILHWRQRVLQRLRVGCGGWGSGDRQLVGVDTEENVKVEWAVSEWRPENRFSIYSFIILCRLLSFSCGGNLGEAITTYVLSGYKGQSANTVKPVLNGPFIERNFVLNENIFKSHDYRSIP
jgi:hypothetical protein